MPSREKPDQDSIDYILLADDDFTDFRSDGVKRLLTAPSKYPGGTSRLVEAFPQCARSIFGVPVFTGGDGAILICRMLARDIAQL